MCKLELFKLKVTCNQNKMSLKNQVQKNSNWYYRGFKSAEKLMGKITEAGQELLCEI